MSAETENTASVIAKEDLIEKALDQALSAPEGEKKPIKRKNPRFGRNSDGTAAPKAEKKPIERKSQWGKFLAAYKEEHPDLCAYEATIEARKVYQPANGKSKSFERIFTEVWKQRNPKWVKMDKATKRQRIREDFIKSF